MKKEKELNLFEVKEIVRLLKIADDTDYVRVADVAKEGGWKKTELMQFILRYNGHFNTATIHRKNQKNLGLLILDVYKNAEDNPESQEYIDKMKKEYENAISMSISPVYGDYYQTYTVYAISIDTEEHKSQYGNTSEKFNRITDLLEKKLKEDIHYYYNQDGEKVGLSTKNEEIITILENAGWKILK